jgi:hypothetical protein
MARDGVALTLGVHADGVASLAVSLASHPGLSMSVPILAGTTPAQLAERLESLARCEVARG